MQVKTSTKRKTKICKELPTCNLSLNADDLCHHASTLHRQGCNVASAGLQRCIGRVATLHWQGSNGNCVQFGHTTIVFPREVSVFDAQSAGIGSRVEGCHHKHICDDVQRLPVPIGSAGAHFFTNKAHAVHCVTSDSNWRRASQQTWRELTLKQSK